jgi:hypothetical protein
VGAFMDDVIVGMDVNVRNGRNVVACECDVIIELFLIHSHLDTLAM